MLILRGLIGLAVLVLLAWLLSSHRTRFPWRVVLWGYLLQIGLAFLVLRSEAGEAAIKGAAWVFKGIVSQATGPVVTLFGQGYADTQTHPAFGPGIAFAASGLVIVIFFSSLMAVLYHLGVLQVVIWTLARLLARVLGVSGAESMAIAANVFVGQTEAPLVIKPYLERLTRSELFAVMTGGFATIAGSVMAIYISMLGDELGPHLFAASVMSAPAAFVFAKVIMPETEDPKTGAHMPLELNRTSTNLVDAAAQGATDGMRLWLNIIAMILAFVALVNLVNWPLSAWVLWEEPMSLSRIFGWVFAPLAWVIGISSWQDCQVIGSLIGTKVAVNEFIAYLDLQAIIDNGELEDERSGMMAAYMLCGFANFGSIGIQIGGIAALVPSLRTKLADIALRAMIAGLLASLATATVAGMFSSLSLTPPASVGG
ncbi:NupC/NupG family nucleoside CNT transporter [Mucisphaera calidilacus]|uniref:Pseudouridine transporter n=1 Tax=Mucisphaera calidilacus TaxID=2527982 RepID=A0A518BUZ4_9BACT|nr:nucleoside transporter C-terminal domain-containing protein [Mucisphaera calidilacus]QDU70754.1 Putative pseudouridine transporter [Mucisphaera calidilacus]